MILGVENIIRYFNEWNDSKPNKPVKFILAKRNVTILCPPNQSRLLQTIPTPLIFYGSMRYMKNIG
jgi:hypothetical protein